MLASEDKRLALRNRLIETLGEEEARTLMDSLPPVPWDRIATKDDLKDINESIEGNRAASEAGEQSLRSEMHAEFANFRAEMAAEFAMLRAENKEFRGEIALQLAKQTRTMVFTMLAFAVPTWGLILAFGIS